MNTFHPGFEARSAVRQIRSLARAGVLTGTELDRLLAKAEAGIEHMLDEPEPPAVPQAVRPAAGGLGIVDGGRS